MTGEKLGRSADAIQPPGSPLGQEIVRPLCLDLVATWTKELEKITIEDLCMRARETGIDSVAASTADFSI